MHLRPDPDLSRFGVVASSLDKVLWPAVGFTKGEMLDYYARVAGTLLPHVADRPLTLGRFPDGVDGPGFAQIECRGRPPWVRSEPVRLRDGRLRNFCLADDVRSLLWIANLGTIELHAFLGAGRALECPAAMLFVLDPEPPAGMVETCRIALLVRDRLEACGLRSVAKTTGGSGLHVLVPLNSPHTYAQTRTFARELAQSLARDSQGVATSATSRDRRAGTVLIDWAQNNERRSMVAPYSLRANVVPFVSAPVTWEEVKRVAEGRAHPGSGADGRLQFGPEEALDRIERLGDLFAPALSDVQSVAGLSPG